jgi:hypothetical protein
VDVASAATAKAFTAGWTDDLPDLHLLRLTLEDGKGRVLSRNTYWRYRNPAALQALTVAQETKLSGTITHLSRSGARHELTATIGNRGPGVAAMVRVSLLDDTSGHRVLPTLYSHNYLWLLPGEAQTVTLSWPGSALPSGRPVLKLEAYNSRASMARP